MLSDIGKVSKQVDRQAEQTAVKLVKNICDSAETITPFLASTTIVCTRLSTRPKYWKLQKLQSKLMVPVLDRPVSHICKWKDPLLNRKNKAELLHLLLCNS